MIARKTYCKFCSKSSKFIINHPEKIKASQRYLLKDFWSVYNKLCDAWNRNSDFGVSGNIEAKWGKN